MWWACEHPNRPANPDIRWHFTGCVGCRLRASLVRDRESAGARWIVRMMEAAEL